jgi:threonine dehydrogenase-like Zn-dependent dehydrogenase
VAVFGAGPVGQLAILSAYLQGAGRVIAVDHNADRLALAQAQHAETVNFDSEEPVAAIRELTGGIGDMPALLRLVAEGGADPALLITENEPMSDVLAAYREFDRREPGWVKVALDPAA